MNAQTSVSTIRRLFWLGLRFGLVGLGSVAAYFALLYILQPIVRSTVVLTTICYAASAVLNYTLQSGFTFRTRISQRAVLRYLIMHGICMTLNSTMMFLLVDVVGLGLFIAQIFVTGLVAAVSFALSYSWVYR